MKGADRYAFVSVSSAGLLLDLDSGALLRLNESAALVWQLFLSGQGRAEIASALGSRYRIDGERAREDVAVALDQAAASGPAAPNDGFVYQRSPAGYVQSLGGQPVLEVDARGEHLRVIAPVSERRPRQLNSCLRAIAPKVLSLRGHTVIHASAVVIASRLLVFGGPTGAGKTTTARSLVDRGATAVCEDKLVVRVDGDTVMAWKSAETSIEAWITRAAITLLADGVSPCVALDEAAVGEQIPLAEVGYVDAARRRDGNLVASQVSPLDAAAELFSCTFLGSDAAVEWQRNLKSAAAIATRVPSYELTMPANLTALSLAAKTLVSRGTLRA